MSSGINDCMDLWGEIVSLRGENWCSAPARDVSSGIDCIDLQGES